MIPTETTSRPDGVPPGPRVLVVEDNLVNRKVAVRMLTRIGCRVEIAGNGLEALQMVEASRYDAVFLDCMMPVMDGYVATQRIRALPGPAAKTPIIALTANAMVGDRERCLAAGMDDYLSKPVEQEQLAAALSRWVGVARGASPPGSGADPSAATPVNPDVLEGFRRLQEPGEPDVVLEFIDLFLDDLPTRLAAIRAARHRGDLERTRAEVHGLKSSAAYLGAAALSQRCRDIEASARAGDAAATAIGIEALDREAEIVVAYLQSQRPAPLPHPR